MMSMTSALSVYLAIIVSKNLQKSSAIQNNSITLLSEIIAIIVPFLYFRNYKDRHTTIKGGMLPPLMVVYKTSNNMTLEKIYNKWLSIQPLSEADQNKLSMRFTVEYNYNSNHLEGNILTYGQTELLLLFGKVSGEGHLIYTSYA